MRNTNKYCVLLSFLISFSSYQTFPQTHVSEGNINGKFLRQNSPYLIEGEIKIPRGKKLIIEPGVRVIFNGHYKFIVNGILEAKGNERDSIYFFPSDTSVGWHGIRFIEAEDFCTLEYCVLRYGKTTMGDDKVMNECKSDPQCDEMDFDGGALLLNRSHAFVSHCLITNNAARMNGGGIAIENNSNPVIRDCSINNNIGGQGGGIYCSNGSNPEIRNCIISGNCGNNLGSGITFLDYCSPVVDSCIIKNNTGAYRGGGICFYTNSKPVVKNSLIYNNQATLGGGIFIDEFYNEFREIPGKIDIRINKVRIEKNYAEYGGGVWIRDTMGELEGVTICYNKALMGGGVYVEYNPVYFKFSSEYLCSVFLNFARIIGNDFFKLGAGIEIPASLDTFTVKNYSALNVEPVEKFALTIKNFKLTQVYSDFYVSQDGNDSNSGTSTDKPLKTLRMALLRILADSTNPRTVYMANGEYDFNETDDIHLLGKHKYVSVEGEGFSDIIFSTERITVLTPWWIRPRALIVYIFAMISVIVIIWNVRMKRIKIYNELERERFEAEKLHEIDEMKSRFFTNISHEFRTPLTLILDPAKNILENTQDPKTKQNASLIKRNAGRLLGLINQLLEISKLESGKMKLETTPRNIVPLLKGYVLSFASYAERKRIILKFSSTEDEITIYLDKDKFDKIIANILSNAFKFTPGGGLIEVNVSRGDNYLCIKVSDSGTGIPADRIDKIFDRFYQIDGSYTGGLEGTGIGLSLTKELIELHKGKIEVESEPGKGSAFIISLPLGKEHLKPEEIRKADTVTEYGTEGSAYDYETDIKSEAETNSIVSSKDSFPFLLIIEDNSDVRTYIKENLKADFRILEAVDGEDGWIKSIEQIPDLIISDVMMPKIDGIKLCKKLKTDERTSHIPVILLTARAAKEDKISGYETGADEYLMKPFDTDELKSRIKNLIEQRKRLREHFREQGLAGIDQQKITSIDKMFLQKSLDIITKHISDSNFSVELLSEELSISRSVLQRKINSLAGESPASVIRRIRLNRAVELIKKRFGTISEIALEVGYNNPAHFSEAFKKQFGTTPSRFQQNNRNNS